MKLIKTLLVTTLPVCCLLIATLTTSCIRGVPPHETTENAAVEQIAPAAEQQPTGEDAAKGPPRSPAPVPVSKPILPVPIEVN